MKAHKGALVTAGFAVVVPIAISEPNVLDAWGSLLILATVATALNLVAGLAGQMSLGHAALMGAGAYSAGVVATRTDLNLFFELLIASFLGIVIGALFGIPSLRLKGQFLALATIGGGFIFVRLVGEVSFTGAEQGLIDIPYISLFGRLMGIQMHVIVIALWFALALLIASALTVSRVGRALVAIKDSELGAEMSGIDSYKMKLFIFVVSSAISAIAGVFFAHKEGFLAPESFGLELSLLLLMACIVGGLGRPLGGTVGVSLMVTPFLAFPSMDRFELLFVGVVALSTLYLFPDGITGALRRRRGADGLGSMTGLQPPAAAAAGPDSGGFVARGEGIEKRFGGVVALAGVDIEVTSGSIHAVIGPNGSGKTTLVNCLTGVMSPSAGRVLVGGDDVTGQRPHVVSRLGVARTFQEVATFRSLSTLEGAVVGADWSRRTSRDSRRAAGMAVAALEAVGLDKELRGLSYGQSKRLELARALAANPRLLVLDEPAAGRNPSEIDELALLLVELRSRGVGVLLVDHHINLVLGTADFVTVLDHGVVIARGTPDEIRDNPAVRSAYLGDEVFE